MEAAGVEPCRQCEMTEEIGAQHHVCTTNPCEARMKLNDIIKELVVMAEAQDDNYFEIAEAIAKLFPKNLKEQLVQLVNGPVWDGNIISKTDRGELFRMGLAIRVCCKGEQGYTGATYTGYSVAKHFNKPSN